MPLKSRRQLKKEENDDSKSKLNNDSYLIIKTDHYQESVIFEDITNYESESVNDSSEKEIPRAVEAQVFKDSKEYTKVLKEKRKHFLEQTQFFIHNLIKML